MSFLARVPFSPQLLASLILRAQQVFYRKGRMRAAQFMQVLGTVLVGADFVPGVQVGKGLALVHPVGAVFGSGARLGDNVLLASGVVFGAGEFSLPGDEGQSYPTIGDRVFIGAHAVVLGGVVIGNDAVIGANSVVTRDVPEGMLAVGAPAKVVGPYVRPAGAR